MQASPSEPTFIHSGDAGDLIYALPVIKHLAPNGATLILGTKTKVRKTFDAAWAANLTPLLQAQPYIKAVRLQTSGDSWTHDLDPFRDLLFKRHIRGKSIGKYVCDAVGAPYSCLDSPWLTVDYPVHVEGKPVVINRTERYNNPGFPWQRVIAAYRHQYVFVGMQHEWERFCFSYGDMPFCPTENALELARMIAGCKLFVGNQSLAYAIAEGLKQNTVQETHQRFPDCMYMRLNAWFGTDGRVLLPELKTLS